MVDRPVINIVSAQCQPADEEKINRWYNEVHVPMLMKFPKIKGVARYKAIGKPDEPPRFIAIYRFDSLKDFEEFGASPEMAAAMKDVKETWGTQGIGITSRVQYELIKEWER